MRPGARSHRLGFVSRAAKSEAHYCADKKKPRRSEAKSTWTPIGLDGCFELLGSAEGDLLAGLDLDCLARGRVAAHARRALSHLQYAQAIEADSLAFLQMLGDHLDHVREHGVDLRFLRAMVLGQRRGQVA